MMTEQKPLYRIVFKHGYPNLQDEINILAAQGYEVICYGPGNPDVHPSVVMRLCANENLLDRMDELMALAQQIRHSQEDIEARLQVLEGWRPMANEDIENLEASSKSQSNYQDRVIALGEALGKQLQALEIAQESHLQAHDSIGIRAQTLRNRVDRLETVAEAAHQGVQGVLARLRVLESVSDSVLDPRD